MIQIDRMLKSRGLKSKVLREEYLDHYCSEYETKLNKGTSPATALHQIQREINTMNVKLAHQEYFDLHFKKPILMVSTLLVLISFPFFIPSDNDALLVDHIRIDTTEQMTVFISYEEPPSINPVADEHFNIASEFGMRMHPVQKVNRFHSGVDIRATIGTAVLAPSDGIITFVGFGKKKGNYIEIQHDETYSTRYYHLSKIDVKVDQEIKIGSKIGEIGNTGASFTPHLHYEVIKAGKNVDPKKYLKV